MGDFLDKSDNIRDALFAETDDEDINAGDILHSDDDCLSDSDEYGDESEPSGVFGNQDTETEASLSLNSSTPSPSSVTNGYVEPMDDLPIDDVPNTVNTNVNRPFVNSRVEQGNDNNLCSQYNIDVCPLCKWHHNDGFEPQQIVFDQSRSGILCTETLNETEWREIDIFHEMFEYDFVLHIAGETNKYYSECTKGVLSEHSKLNKWQNTYPDELYRFFATSLLMSHCKKNTIKQYWSTDPLIQTPIFSKIISQDRYLLLRRVLHFDDNCNATGGDKLYKIRTVIETLRRKYQSMLYPFKNLVIDESLMLWKGRLSFRQYLPNKRKRFGIKTFVLCDCLTGFILDFIVYTGQGSNIEEDGDSGLSSRVIKTLMRPYINKNHVLYMDNWYSSPTLFSWLHDKQTGACGTLNANRKGVPCLPKKMKKDEVVVRHNEKMITVRWCDRRPVTMLSTVDKHEMVSVNTRSSANKLKPKCVTNYNKNMGAVDKSDMLLSYNDCTRKTVKWYTKLFFHLLDIAVLNAYYIYRHRVKEQNPNVHIHLMDFRLNLIRQLLETHTATLDEMAPPPPARPVATLRLTGRHFMRPLPKSQTKNRILQRQCYVCMHTSKAAKKRKDTSWECSLCETPLCAYPCFEQYHTQNKF